MKILNLYAGIGGNRKYWDGEVHAVEQDLQIAMAYNKFYPEDHLYLADAHEILLQDYAKYDFIWSSPPCQSHGQYRYNIGVRAKGYKPLFPDMKLYEEIIFLQHHCKGKWVVENTNPYYQPLIEPTTMLGRHLFWSNFEIPYKEFAASGIRTKNKLSDFDVDISDSKIVNKRQVLRNMVDPELGRYILECANK